MEICKNKILKPLQKYSVFLSSIFMFFLTSCGDMEEYNINDYQIIKFGLLTSLSGSGEYTGQVSKVAIEIAVEHYNEQLRESGEDYQFKPYIFDTQTNPDTALKGMQYLKRKGIHFVVGPYSSASAKKCVEFANKNDMYIFTVSAIATALAKPDNLYRLIPDMKAMTKATLKAIEVGNPTNYRKINHLSMIYRNDLWGATLADDLKTKITEDSVDYDEVKNIFPYDVSKISEDIIISKLGKKIKSAIENNQKRREHLGVILISFSEGTKFLEEAAKYDYLDNIIWYGSSAYAEDPTIIENSVASEFAYRTKFSCPLAAIASNRDKWGHISSEIASITGYKPNSYGVTAYDAAMLAMRCSAEYNFGDNILVNVMIHEELENYDCITGNFKFDENGDRPNGKIAFWSVRKAPPPDFYQWVQTGTYDIENDNLKLSKSFYE